LILRTCVSAPEHTLQPRGAGGARCAPCPADVVEIAAWRSRGADVLAQAARRGLRLPAFGEAAVGSDRIALCVRPDRWLLLGPQARPGERAAAWQDDCRSLATVVDLSSALAVLRLSGPAAREVLARGCRLDLDPGIFRAGQAAATVIAQVAVTVVALSSGVLLLTPATTARHFEDWLAAAATPFGFELRAAMPFANLSGDGSP
jgi:heterotetrameric sarcosine oxidase gamma subunit